MWRKVERFDAVYCPTYDESWGAIGETHASYVHGVGQSGPVVEVTIDAAGGTGRPLRRLCRSPVKLGWCGGCTRRVHRQGPRHAVRAMPLAEHWPGEATAI